MVGSDMAKLILVMGGIAVVIFGGGFVSIIIGLGVLSFKGILICLLAGFLSRALLQVSWVLFPKRYPPSIFMWGMRIIIALGALIATLLSLSKTPYYHVQFLGALGLAAVSDLAASFIWEKKPKEKKD